MITLHHLDQSRSFRILWALEELGLDYKNWIRAEYMEVEIKSDSELEDTVIRAGLWHAIGYRLQGQRR